MPAVLEKTAKIFANGGSQAIRLPKEFRFGTDEVILYKENDTITIKPHKRKYKTTKEFLDSLEPLEGFPEHIDRSDNQPERNFYFE